METGAASDTDRRAVGSGYAAGYAVVKLRSAAEEEVSPGAEEDTLAKSSNEEDAAAAPPALWIETRDMAFCVAGVMTAHIAYGYYQEQLMTRLFFSPDAPLGERFQQSSFTTLCNRSVTLLLASLFAAGSKLLHGGNPVAVPLPAWDYSMGAISNTISSVAQYASLQFVSFPILVLAKACKMPPVMLFNSLVYGRRYRAFEYTSAILVLFGASLFLMYDHQKVVDVRFVHKTTAGGLLLISLYLFADAFTSTWQGSVFSKGTAMSAMLLWSSLWSLLFSAVSTVTTSELAGARSFLSRHPEAWSPLCLVSICSSLGTFFVLYTIQRFGPLAFASISTVRQLFSSILSIVVFHHSVHLLQAVGLLVTFGSLGMMIRIKRYERAKSAGKGSLGDNRRASGAEEQGAEPAEPLPDCTAKWSPQRKALGVSIFVTSLSLCKTVLLRGALQSTSGHDATGHVVRTTGIAYSATSCAVTILCLTGVFILRPSLFRVPERAAAKSLALIIAIAIADLATANAAAARLPAALQPLTLALGPIFTVALESAFGCHLKRPLQYAAAAGITVGGFLVAYGRRPTGPGAVQPAGIALALVAAMASASKYVLLRRERNRRGLGLASLVFWVDMPAFTVCTAIALCDGEFKTLVDALVDGGPALSALLFVAACVSGVGFGSQVFALRFLSALDLSAVNSAAHLLYALAALRLPTLVSLGVGEPPEGGSPAPSSPSLLAAGLLVALGSLTAHWRLRYSRAARSAAARCVATQLATDESDLRRGPRGSARY